MKENLRSLAILLIGSIIGYFVTSTYIFSGGKIIGKSMEPTYHEGNNVIVNRLQLILRDPAKNEIVQIRDINGDKLIKRIVAVPGELSPFPVRSIGYIILKKDQYFVMGDNRKISDDSRNFGPVHRSQIVGVIE